MSRPKPSVLIENTNKQTYKSEQVLASDGIWAVFFNSLHINDILSMNEFLIV
jgi:hypothetical protein